MQEQSCQKLAGSSRQTCRGLRVLLGRPVSGVIVMNPRNGNGNGKLLTFLLLAGLLPRCLLSGNYTPRHDVSAVHGSERGPVEQMRLVPVPNRDGLMQEDVTIAESAGLRRDL